LRQTSRKVIPTLSMISSLSIWLSMCLTTPTSGSASSRAEWFLRKTRRRRKVQ
jgi:hypothetical protein